MSGDILFDEHTRLLGAVMGARSPNRGGRPVSPETVRLAGVLEGILAEQHPMTTRGAFYAASVAGAVDKTEAGYSKVQRLLVKMRERGEIPFAWIADGTRWRRGPNTSSSVEEALQETARLYRRSLWDFSEERVEVWLEKEALASVITPITNAWTVDLMVCRGYPSLSYLHSAAEYVNAIEKPLTIYYLGDLDPSGKDIVRVIRRRLTEFDVDFTLTELAVTDEQVAEWNLPTRPTKKSDTRAKAFTSAASVELDAIQPARLRALVDAAIAAHVDPHQLTVLEAAEASEREVLYRLSEAA